MTREEIIYKLNDIRMQLNDGQHIEMQSEIVDIIKSLQSEPCEDYISRKAVLNMATTIHTDDYSGNEYVEIVEVEDIEQLPSVTPTRKKAKWILIGDSCKCSNCKDVYSLLYPYCPNCGAEMESEDKCREEQNYDKRRNS